MVQRWKRLFYWRWLCACLMLSGCEILQEGEGPTELTCRAECAECKSVILECDGQGRATTVHTTKVNKP
jgi:hypothetical protein